MRGGACLSFTVNLIHVFHGIAHLSILSITFLLHSDFLVSSVRLCIQLRSTFDPRPNKSCITIQLIDLISCAFFFCRLSPHSSLQTPSLVQTAKLCSISQQPICLSVHYCLSGDVFQGFLSSSGFIFLVLLLSFYLSFCLHFQTSLIFVFKFPSTSSI